MKTKLKKISEEHFKLDDETIKEIESLSEDEINSILKDNCENYRYSQNLNFTRIPQTLMNASKYAKVFYQLLNAQKYEGKLVLSTEELYMLFGTKTNTVVQSKLKSLKKEIEELFDTNKIDFYISIDSNKNENTFTGYTFTIHKYKNEKEDSDRLTFKEVKFFHDLHEFLESHDCNIFIENNMLHFQVDTRIRTMPVRFDVDKLHDYIVINATKAGEKYKKPYEALNKNREKEERIYSENGLDHNSHKTLSDLPQEIRKELEKLMDEDEQLYDSIKGIGKVDYLDEYPELCD